MWIKKPSPDSSTGQRGLTFDISIIKLNYVKCEDLILYTYSVENPYIIRVLKVNCEITLVWANFYSIYTFPSQIALFCLIFHLFKIWKWLHVRVIEINYAKEPSPVIVPCHIMGERHYTRIFSAVLCDIVDDIMISSAFLYSLISTLYLSIHQGMLLKCTKSFPSQSW